MKTIQIFVGGGVSLLRGDADNQCGYRTEVLDPVISELNSQEFAKYFYITKDYADLTRNVVKGKQQEEYNDFIRKKAKIALFIIDGKIGSITKEELDIAVKSTRKNDHPIVYVYGINVDPDSALSVYLNQKGIYYQHFHDKRDLYAKIKSDIQHSSVLFDRKHKQKLIYSGLFSFLLLTAIYGLVTIFARHYQADDVPTITNPLTRCNAQLYLMRYQDVNVYATKMLFTEENLTVFKYEDSIKHDTDEVFVFPEYSLNQRKVIQTTPPFFRLKIYNKDRNTLVFNEAVLEVSDYKSLTLRDGNVQFKMDSLDLSAFQGVEIVPEKREYPLKDFRRSVAYGEPDDNYFFYIACEENCDLNMRIRIKDIEGNFLYSNYIHLEYVR